MLLVRNYRSLTTILPLSGPSDPGEVPGADTRHPGCGAHLCQHGALRCQVTNIKLTKFFH